MKRISWNEIPFKELYVRNIIGVVHNWGDGSACRVYNYKEHPRQSSGLVLYLSSGATYHFPDGTEYSPEAGDLISIPAGSHYILAGEKTVRAYLVVFHLSDENGEQRILSDGVTCILHGNGIRFLETFEKITQLYQTSSRCLIDMQCELLMLIKRLATVMSSVIPSPVEPAIQYISEHLLEGIGIHQLASLCFMSESTFRREFKRCTGLTPARWLQTEKIKKARQLISENDLTVAEIANLLMFFDEAHFRKVFKEYTGMTPTQYRRILPMIKRIL